VSGHAAAAAAAAAALLGAGADAGLLDNAGRSARDVAEPALYQLLDGFAAAAAP